MQILQVFGSTKITKTPSLSDYEQDVYSSLQDAP